MIKFTILQTCLDQNRKTAYDLIASHGDVENLIFFAMLMQGVSLSLCIGCSLNLDYGLD